MDQLIDTTTPDLVSSNVGKEFESLVLNRLDYESERGNGDFGRYGVQVSFVPKEGGGVEPMPIQSLPDIEGVLNNGRQIIWDCKVLTTAASLSLSEYRTSKSKSRQLRHMLNRSKNNAICGFLIHWNSRKLKRTEYPPATHWFPVDERIRFWRDFEAHETSSINRSDCDLYGYRVEWTKNDRERKYRPDVMRVIANLAGVQVFKR